MTQTKQFEQLTQWLKQDKTRMQALFVCKNIFAQHGISDWCIAAGFIRNMVWDNLHQLPSSKLNDIDVIYWSDKDTTPAADQQLERQLSLQLKLPFSVKNQARMHIRNGHQPYTSCVNAMKYWPELQTAIAVKMHNPAECVDDNASIALSHQALTHDPTIVWLAPFGIECLFDFSITKNPLTLLDIFEQRLHSKGWLERYPKLSIV